MLVRLEGLLVALLGHEDETVRSRATILLNVFYDQHDWQLNLPFIPVIKQVGDPFEVSICLDDAANPEKGETPDGILVILSAPCFNIHAPFEVYSYHEVEWKPAHHMRSSISGLHSSTERSKSPANIQRHKWIGTLSFGQFMRCGFYDWRVVRIREELGSWETVQATFSDLRHSSSNSHLLDLRISLTPDEKEASDSMGNSFMHPHRFTSVSH